jgi:hypothetical protein
LSPPPLVVLSPWKKGWEIGGGGVGGGFEWRQFGEGQSGTRRERVWCGGWGGESKWCGGGGRGAETGGLRGEGSGSDA